MHPSREVLIALASETLAHNERTVVVNHVAQCATCRDFLALITPEEGPPSPVAVAKARKAS